MKSNIRATSGQLQTIDLAAIRQRGYSAAQAIIAALCELDEKIGFAVEQTSDDRAGMLEAARRLQLLLIGEGSR